jgi:hypothetical protein
MGRDTVSDDEIKGYAVFVKVEKVRMPLLTDDPDKVKAMVDDTSPERMVAYAVLKLGATAEHGVWTYVGTETA